MFSYDEISANLLSFYYVAQNNFVITLNANSYQTYSITRNILSINMSMVG
jgi:hypothetical protein